jgi:hypothetical protein
MFLGEKGLKLFLRPFRPFLPEGTVALEAI